MPSGGSRSGAGRKKGSTSQKTKERLELAERAVGDGITPLEHMLRIMNDESADTQRRDEMARAAAPYCHPRLSSIDGDLNLHLHKHEEALAELE